MTQNHEHLNESYEEWRVRHEKDKAERVELTKTLRPASETVPEIADLERVMANFFSKQKS